MNSYVLTVSFCETYIEKGLVFWHCEINRVLDFVVIEEEMAVVIQGCNFARILDEDSFLLSGDTTFSKSHYTIKQIYKRTHHWVDCQVLPELSVENNSFIAVLSVDTEGRSMHRQLDTDKAYLKHLLFDVVAEGGELFDIYDKRSHEWEDLRPESLQAKEEVR